MSKLLLVGTLFLGLSVAACGTLEGAGKDLSRAGEAVQDVAR